MIEISNVLNHREPKKSRPNRSTNQMAGLDLVSASGCNALGANSAFAPLDLKTNKMFALQTANIVAWLWAELYPNNETEGRRLTKTTS